MYDFESMLRQYLEKNITSEMVTDAIKKSGIPLAKFADPKSKEQLIHAAANFADILHKKQIAAYRKEGIATTDVPMATTRGFDDSGDVMTVRVEFAEGALHRDSWSPRSQDEGGVYNIMGLLNSGYTLKSKMTPYKIVEKDTKVFGTTIKAGHRMYARRHRDAMGFIEAAIEEFRAKYGDAYEIIPDASFGG